MDTWFGSYYSTTAQHDEKNVIGGWGDTYYTLLRFDLSGLPLVATKAYIYRHTVPMASGFSTAIRWYRITAPWQSHKATYGNFPFFATEHIATYAAPTADTWYRTDVTTLYNQWRAAGATKTLNYGVILEPVLTDNKWSSIDSSKKTGFGPRLKVEYTPQSNDGVIKLKWPLGTAKPSSPSSGGAFGDYWGVGVKKCSGLSMTHTGVDIPNTVDNPVYAAEDGVVREILSPTETGGWASAIVLEHNHPVSGKYTTVYWHVTPAPGIVVASGQDKTFIPKGMKIATIANLYPKAGNHLHFGVRLGDYDSTYSDKGALPTGTCSELKSFKENFINPWSTSNVIFQ